MDLNTIPHKHISSQIILQSFSLYGILKTLIILYYILSDFYSDLSLFNE